MSASSKRISILRHGVSTSTPRVLRMRRSGSDVLLRRHSSRDRAHHVGWISLGNDQDLTMKFRPLHDRVVLRRIEGEEKTKGGIIIPDTVKEKPQEGEVVAVGPGARDEAGKVNALEVKAGDRVLFGKWSGTEVKIDGQDLLIMKESDILGIVA
jgi:chaperonin GroES